MRYASLFVLAFLFVSCDSVQEERTYEVRYEVVGVCPIAGIRSRSGDGELASVETAVPWDRTVSVTVTGDDVYWAFLEAACKGGDAPDVTANLYVDGQRVDSVDTSTLGRRITAEAFLGVDGVQPR